MALMKERQKEFVLEQIIQMDELVRGITTDISAFKNIRTQLFHQEGESEKQKPSQKYFLIFFHLFESVVNNVSRLVDRYSTHLIS